MTPDPQAFEPLSDRHLAFLAGLLVGEGSFTMQGHWPTCDLRMTARHEHLLRLVHTWQPLSRFYGPYQPSPPRQPIYLVRWRGAALRQLIRDLERFELSTYCPHVGARMARIKEALTAEGPCVGGGNGEGWR